jgi:Cytochrome c7 and related cytochrome c
VTSLSLLRSLRKLLLRASEEPAGVRNGLPVAWRQGHIKKLAEFAKSKTPIPWARVYAVPDYVYFSHALHVQEARVECETCHGPIAAREAVFKEKPINMSSCIDCHARHDASKGCDTCHTSR